MARPPAAWGRRLSEHTLPEWSTIKSARHSMRLTSIAAADIKPIKSFSVANLSDVVVIAGPNGVGKTRLITAMVAFFQSANSNAPIKLTLDATSDTERSDWGKSSLNTADPTDVAKLAHTLQKAKKRSNWESSVLNFESDRSIQQVAPYSFNWDYEDPDLEAVTWNFGLGGLRGRFQDTLHSIFRKVRSRREKIAKRAEYLFKTSAGNKPVQLDPNDFPDPLDSFKQAFRQLLAPKNSSMLTRSNSSCSTYLKGIRFL
jgi:hypothetical protein